MKRLVKSDNVKVGDRLIFMGYDEIDPICQAMDGSSSESLSSQLVRSTEMIIGNEYVIRKMYDGDSYKHTWIDSFEGVHEGFHWHICGFGYAKPFDDSQLLNDIDEFRKVLDDERI